MDYSDILEITLPRMVLHGNVTVVTSPKDKKTFDLCQKYGLKPFITDAFYRDGEYFNKGCAIEECFDYIGRQGWMMIIDADIVLPREINKDQYRRNKLYTPIRRLLTDWKNYTPTINPQTLPARRDLEWAGYCQIFHAGDPVLITTRPWYGINWQHAGGCDSVFQMLWDDENKLRPDFEVIHLGETNQNWCGRIDNLTNETEKKKRLEAMDFFNKNYRRPSR